jgi:hypothetical protein
MPTSWQTFPIEFRGGLISNLSPLQQGINKVGSATTLQNYEPAREGGYRKLLGYTKFSNTVVPGSGVVLGVKLLNAGELITARSNGTVTQYHIGSGTTWTSLGAAASLGGRIASEEFNFGSIHKVLFVDSVNYPAVYNDTTNTLSFLTGAPADVQGAKHARLFKNHIFYAKGTTLTFSAPYNESDFTPANGAGIVDIGHTITGLAVFRDILVVFARNKVMQITGNSIADFSLQPITEDIGCVSGDTIQEIGGDIIYLAPDGLRLLSATDRNDDFALEIASAPIEKDARIIIDSTTTYSSIVIRGKAQYRLFAYIPTDSAMNHRGLLATKFSDQGASRIEWATTKGIKAYATESKYSESGEAVYFGNNDGYIYTMESGNSFDGAIIPAIYESPYMPINDPQLRKTLYKLTLYVTPTGSFNIQCGIKFDFNRINNAAVIQPSVFNIVSTGGAVALWGAPGTTWGSFSYGGELDKVYINQLIGSGKTFAIRFDDNTTNPSHTLDAAIVEFMPHDRQ